MFTVVCILQSLVMAEMSAAPPMALGVVSPRGAAAIQLLAPAVAGRWWLHLNLGKVLRGTRKSWKYSLSSVGRQWGKRCTGVMHSRQPGLLSTQLAMPLSRQDPAEPLSLEAAEYLISCMLPCIYIA